jgi:hypothetical protein
MTLKSKWGFLALLLGALVVPLASSAQAGPGARTRTRVFDPKSVTTIQGEISDIQRVPRGRHEGVHVTVQTGTDRVAVQLGPAFYVDRQTVKLAKGDQVEVKGARATVGGQPVIIAQEVRRGDAVLALRDANGVPLWSGAGRR